MKVRIGKNRQITLPADFCEKLGLKPGDVLDARVNGGAIHIGLPPMNIVDVLEEISRALREAGVTEEELLKSGRQIRRELAHEKYPQLFPDPE